MKNDSGSWIAWGKLGVDDASGRCDFGCVSLFENYHPASDTYEMKKEDDQRIEDVSDNGSRKSYGLVMIMGGSDKNGKGSKRVWIWDCWKKSFSREIGNYAIPDLPVEISYCRACLATVHGERVIYVMGSVGFYKLVLPVSVWESAVEADATWQHAKSNEQQPKKKKLKYNLKWQTIHKHAVHGEGFALVSTNSNILYRIAGSHDPTGIYQYDTSIDDPKLQNNNKSNQQSYKEFREGTKVANLFLGRSNFATTVLTTTASINTNHSDNQLEEAKPRNFQIYIIGGLSLPQRKELSSVEVFSTSTNTCSFGPKLPVALSHSSAITIASSSNNDCIVVTGGKMNSTPQRKSYICDTATPTTKNTWITWPQVMIQSFAQHHTTALQPNTMTDKDTNDEGQEEPCQIFILGGINDSSNTGKYKFNPIIYTTCLPILRTTINTGTASVELSEPTIDNNLVVKEEFIIIDDDTAASSYSGMNHSTSYEDFKKNYNNNKNTSKNSNVHNSSNTQKQPEVIIMDSSKEMEKGIKEMDVVNDVLLKDGNIPDEESSLLLSSGKLINDKENDTLEASSASSPSSPSSVPATDDAAESTIKYESMSSLLKQSKNESNNSNMNDCEKSTFTGESIDYEKNNELTFWHRLTSCCQSKHY